MNIRVWAGKLGCMLGWHDWQWHHIVKDWFCNRCRKRKNDIGVRR